jgi:hypothetical protein
VSELALQLSPEAKRRPNDGEFEEFVSDCWPFFRLGLYG